MPIQTNCLLPFKTNKSLNLIKYWLLNQLCLCNCKVIKKGKNSECDLTNQDWVKIPKLKIRFVSMFNCMIKLVIKTECFQWCHWINNPLLKETAEEPVNITRRVHPTSCKESVSQSLIPPIISLFSKHQHSHTLSLYHAHKLNAKSIVNHSFSPSAYLI